jgi:hypothetical protein
VFLSHATIQTQEMKERRKKEKIKEKNERENERQETNYLFHTTFEMEITSNRRFHNKLFDTKSNSSQMIKLATIIHVIYNKIYLFHCSLHGEFEDYK